MYFTSYREEELRTLLSSAEMVNEVPVLAASIPNVDMNNLRTMADELKQKIGSVVLVLGSVNEGKVNIIAGVTKDLMDKGYHAGKIVKEVASICGGGGGGRPDMAQAGGKDPSKLNDALDFVEEYVKSV